MNNNKTKPTLHPRNAHHGRYDFAKLTNALAELATVTKTNPNGEPTIDFSNKDAVLLLNKALLKTHYGVKFWDIPTGYLCPPIPSRADYIHHVADLLTEINDTDNQPPKGKNIRILDVGTGANCIYPIIGSQSYGWHFTATDIDPVSINTVKAITQNNPNLLGHIKPVLQKNSTEIFNGIIKPDTYFHATMCNPPFHASYEDAVNANVNKQNKLAKNKAIKTKVKLANNDKINSQKLNFGGQSGELWCQGGELGFLKKMINESKSYANNVGWFTSLVSKQANIAPLHKALEKANAREIKIINMQHGQKKSRVLAWYF